MTDKSKAIELADWADWFCRNAKDPEDFRWKHMADSAQELRRLHAENEILKDLCKRSFRALCDDDFPILREELCHFTKEENHHD